jgi:4-hydroxy-2-oxoglutarate aldolase
MLTPFHENGDVDYEAFAANIEKWNTAPLGGYLVLGSNSEAIYLTEKEKLKLIDLTVKTADPTRAILAGTGMESTRATIDLTNKAAKAGTRAALILTPFYYGSKMDDTALITYFTDVADHADIPIMIYNVTKFTHINVSAKAVSVLSQHPNIIGMKDSSGNIPQLVGFQSVIAKDFNLMVGTASAWYPALSLGVTTGIMALANIAPDECARVQQAFESGDYTTAQALYRQLFPVNTAITATYGVAGLKYAADLRGYQGGFVRKPLLQLQEDAKTDITNILDAAHLLG